MVVLCLPSGEVAMRLGHCDRMQAAKVDNRQLEPQTHVVFWQQLKHVTAMLALGLSCWTAPSIKTSTKESVNLSHAHDKNSLPNCSNAGKDKFI